MTETVGDVGRLLAIEEIKALKARYFRAIDEKDEPLLRSVFADDVEVDFGDEPVLSSSASSARPVIVGADAVCAAVMRAVEPFTTVHHGHMPEITVTGAATAEGVWAMCDMLWARPGGAQAGRVGYGYYRERYVRVHEHWRIQALRLSRIRVEELRPAGASR